jgi:hypothetical protein
VLQLVGRDTKTGTLVRYEANPPDWSASDAPEEFTHWLRHTNQSGWYYRVATGPDGRNVIWTRRSTPDGSCPGPFGWHVSKDKPDLELRRSTALIHRPHRVPCPIHPWTTLQHPPVKLPSSRPDSRLHLDRRVDFAAIRFETALQIIVAEVHI